MFDMKTNEGVMESLRDFAKTAFNPEVPLFPMFILVTEDGHAEIVAGVFDGEGSKDAISSAVRKRIRDIGAVRIGFLSEAWTVSNKDDPSMKPGYKGSLADHPDRREVIQIIVEDKWGKGSMHTINIERKSDTEATLEDTGKDFLKEVGTSYTGRFANFFDTPHVTTH